jgi:peptidyl-dipeptidase Dcp
MNKILSMPLIAIVGLSASCSNNNSTSSSETAGNGGGGPFADTSILAYQAPDFKHIRNSDFQPALEEGMKQQLAEMGKIADNPDGPTFENTLIAMEKSGQLLARTGSVFNLLSGANTNPDLQKLQETIAPKMAAHQDAIYLNPKLFKRIEAMPTDPI